MLNVQVNLIRLECLENCIRNNNLCIRGSDLRKLETFAQKEHTGFVKKRCLYVQNYTHSSSSSEFNSTTRENSKSIRKIKKRSETRRKKRSELNMTGVVGGGDETSSAMSKDEMERDLKLFVDKHQLRDENKNIGIEQMSYLSFNGLKLNDKMNGVMPNGSTEMNDDFLQRPSTSFAFETLTRSPIKRNIPQLKKDVVPTREELECLAKQVAQLRRQCEDLQKKGIEDESDLEIEEENETLKELQMKLSKTILLNSVTFTTSKGAIEVIEADGDSVLVHQKIEGCVGSLPFTLQILIQRNKLVLKDIEYPEKIVPLEDARIVDLDLTVFKNPNVQEELEPFVEKMRSCRDMMICMNGLEKYANFYTLRQKTFEFFTTNKSLVASLTDDKLGREMLLKNPLNNVRVIITWTFNVLETGHLNPVISLRVKKKKSATAVDTDNVLSKLPSMFQLMQDLYGIERAIGIVVDMMSV